MQRLRIQHSTRYLYSRPVEFTRHRVIIRPREGHDLRIEHMQLRISPAHTLTWVRDVFGNSIALVDFTEPAAVLDIESDVVIQRFAPFPARTLHDPVRVPFPVSYDPLELTVVAAYLERSFPDDTSHITTWMGENLVVNPEDSEGTVLALCIAINKNITYVRRREKGVQTPAQTAQLGSGSCRDMATLLMEAARSLGLAARFASGYLHGLASLAGQASTHAWIEVYLPDLGWRGFDPTLGAAISLRHVVTGVSNHPRGVMPVSGGFVGARKDFLDLIVHVKTEEEPES
ncbi:MAG TPA: transglutaminase family protein [Steroidobacteraceae bacterium]|nr:transglutaminase family protein [Steroidobacteraceae bacterium]